MLQFNSTTPAQPSPLTQPSEFMAAASRQPLPKKKLFGLDRRIVAVVALVLLAGLSSLAIIIAGRQQQLGNAPVAPNAPESQPQAFIAKTDTCSITFNVPAICNARCFADADCKDVHPNWACLGEPNQTHCRLISNPTSETCTPPTISVTPSVTPSPTPSPTLPPGVTPSVTPTLPPELTPTLTPVPPTPSEGATPTNPPGVTVNPTTPGTPPTYTIVTTVNCNYTCSRNSDCSNSSHICYNGRCRLDANPDDATCHLPSGGTTMVVNVLPTQPPAPKELIQSGPADWGNFLTIGLGALGAGSLLLLFL